MTHVKTALIALLAIAVIGVGLLALSAGLPVWVWLISCACASAALVITIAEWLLSLLDLRAADVDHLAPTAGDAGEVAV